MTTTPGAPDFSSSARRTRPSIAGVRRISNVEAVVSMPGTERPAPPLSRLTVRRPVGRERAERPEGCPPERVVARGGMVVDGVAPVAERADATVGISGQRSFERVDRVHWRQADRDPDRERANGDEAEPRESGRSSGAPAGRRPRTGATPTASGTLPRRCPPTQGCSWIAAAHFGGRQAACHVVIEGVVEVTQNEWRFGAADEQGREEPSDARSAWRQLPCSASASRRCNKPPAIARIVV